MSIRIEELSVLDFSDISAGAAVGEVTPGEVLKEEFMRPLALSARALAKSIGVPVNRVTAIINGERTITADTAILLGEYFGNSPQFWLGLQMAHDLERAWVRHGRTAASNALRPIQQHKRDC
jgi:addiction module HigA family antidote